MTTRNGSGKQSNPPVLTPKAVTDLLLMASGWSLAAARICGSESGRANAPGALGRETAPLSA